MQGKRSTILRNWQYYAMLIPGILFTLVFMYFPLYGLIIAFQKYSPVLGFHSPWVGFKNFRQVFALPGFSRAVINTLTISIWKIVGELVVPVFFALLLNEMRCQKVKRVCQTLIYVPHFLSWVIISGVFIDILSPDGGIVNDFLRLFGVKPIYFLGDKHWFPITMIVSGIWKQFGFGTVIYMAALTGIDQGLYEAATVDGANRLQQTIHVTLPGITGIVVLMAVLSIGNVLSAGFDQIFNLYSPVVYETGDVIDTFVYRLGIENAQYAKGTAVGLFKSGVSMLLTCTAYFLADRLANYRIF